MAPAAAAPVAVILTISPAVGSVASLPEIAIAGMPEEEIGSVLSSLFSSYADCFYSSIFGGVASVFDGATLVGLSSLDVYLDSSSTTTVSSFLLVFSAVSSYLVVTGC